MSTQLEIVAATHQGFRRTSNEDRVSVHDWASSESSDIPTRFLLSDDQPLVCLVVDGMGGHAGGQVASKIVASELATNLPRANGSKMIESILEDVNQSVFSAMDDDTYGMGATVAGVHIHNGTILIFNVGDSRIYTFKDENLVQVSTDDALVNYQTNKKLSSAITQSLGGGFKRRRISPHIRELDKNESSMILLCTDGLTDLVDDKEIERVLSLQRRDEVSSLLNLALDNGGTDNISIVSIRITGTILSAQASFL